MDKTKERKKREEERQPQSRAGKRESNEQERKNLLEDMPIDKRATFPRKMRDYGKPTSPVAMRMAATKESLPMKEILKK